MPNVERQNLTLSLPRQTIQKARVIAARRSTSISALIVEQVEALVGKDEAYEAARRSAFELLDHGFNMGGGKLASREELHER